STTTGIAGTSFGTLNVGDVILNTSTGQALVLSTGTVSTPANYAGFTSTTSTGGTNNVSLTTIAGTVNLGSGALSGAGGNGFHVNGGAAGINFSGTISNSTLRQVNIINKTGGTVALSGAISGTGTGIFLNSNTPATINFTGGVVLSTSTNDAFTATGGGTVSVTGAANTLTSTTGIALNVANTTIGASGLTFRSISSNGSSSGIVLNNTGSSAGLTISGNGGSCTSAGTCTGGAIQNTSGRGISLTNTQKVSIDRIFVFTTVNSGIGGTQVVDFTLTNSKLDNNGNTTGNDFSNVGFGIDNLTTENNLSGVVVITGNTLSNSFEHGIDIQNFSGTISNATISNNTITSSTSAAVSKGSGIRLLGFGNAGSTSNITKATISGNTIMNFPGGAGITAQYGNNTSGPAGAWGTTGSAVNRIFIQNNIIQGQSAANPMNTNAILMTLTGKGQANWLADSNGTVGQPITNIGGAEIGVTIRGVNPTATCDITNNRIVGITASAAQGIAFAADFLTLTTDAPQLSGTIIGNNISGQDGEAIQVLATPGSSAHIDVSVKNNTTTAPNCGGCNRFGITAEVGSSSGTTTGAPSMCLNMSGNTAGGSGVNPGIGIRKKTAAYVFNIENFVGGGDPTAFLTGLNPAGGGVLMISQTTGFGNCATAPIAPPDDGGIAKNAPIGPVNADSSEQTQASNTTLTNGGSNASPTTFGWLKEVLHPVAAFATKLNFLQRSEVPVTPTLTPAEKSAAIAGVNGISASQTTEDKKVTPQSGGTVTVNGSGTGFTLPAGKTITITYDATVNTPPLAKSVSTQGTVTGSNFTFVNGINTTPNTDDPETVGGPPDATVTNINTTITWTGASTTDWDTAGNWNPSYIPGSGNDVVIPNVVNQPTLANSSPTINSLNIANSATLTISGQTLTISGNSGSDLTLNGVISGGALNFAGGGPHLIKNAGGTGSISSTNTTTVLSPAVVTLSNSLQMGALAINAGGSMTISGNTLSLNGPGAALSVAGTFTPAARGDDGSPGTPPGDGLQAIGSTVVFNSTTGAQTGAGITYSSLTINNSAGVTFTSDATVNGTLALTSGDLNMGASGQFTLTQPNTTASTGTGDVTGSVKRSGSPLPPAVALTFGNPDNRITFTTTTGFTDITVKLTKATPSGTFGPDPIGWPGAILRTYLITPGNTGTFTSPTLRLHYNDPADLNGNSEGGSGLKLYHYVTSPSHGWQIQSTSVMNAALNFVEQTNVPGFSPWTIANFSTTAATSTVSGRILDDNGNPVEGAVIRLNGTQNRKTITDASGNYNFFEVETNGFYTVTPSRVNYNFAPGTRGFSALGAHTEASFAGTFNGNHQNPLDTTEYFVRQQYVDFLGREPEEKGFNDWTDTINNCGAGDTSCDRVHVSEMFFRSEEFQQRGYFVYRFYSTALGRKPDFAEFTPDMARVSGFLTNDQLEAAKTAFANDFVTRPAFAQYATMTNAQYVDALSQTAGVTLGNRQVLVASLEAGTLTRAQALRQIAESGEVYAKYYNQAFVVMEYFGYLRRDPDILYLNWIDVLNQGGDSRHMVEGFVDATEYRNRFKQ
ncbi:MAG TPA: hypothetical protein VHE60_12595, partial [Pyrinomonadaceae bacterium]|nr:hypothetical protein [Pyrinomonadaceae bacterium]